MQAIQPLALRYLRQASPIALLSRSSRPIFLLQQQRNYATPTTQEERNQELQKKQIRMADKAGRMKQNMGAVSSFLTSLSLHLFLTSLTRHVDDFDSYIRCVRVLTNLLSRVN